MGDGVDEPGSGWMIIPWGPAGTPHNAASPPQRYNRHRSRCEHALVLSSLRNGWHMEYVILDQGELPTIDGARVCEGVWQGETSISMIFVDVPPGGGPSLHRYPYKEVFVVHEGRARFTVGTTSIDVASGKIVMVAAGIPHKFSNTGEGRLLQTDIHLSSRLETEWMES